jgi:hypothetical protein
MKRMLARMVNEDNKYGKLCSEENVRFGEELSVR